MIRQLTILFCFILLVFLPGCMKENGKHDYLFTLVFSNGEQIQTKVTIREKPKKYTDKSDKTYWRHNKDFLDIVPVDPADGNDNEFNEDFLMIKLDDKIR